MNYISLSQAAGILGKTQDEVLYMVQDKRLRVVEVKDTELTYLADGRVEFNKPSEPKWQFELDEVLRAKKALEEGLDGQLQTLLEG